MPSATLSSPRRMEGVRAGTMDVLLSGLRLYSRWIPFQRGRGMFIRPIQRLKQRGWPAPLFRIDSGLVMEFEPSLLGWTTFQRGHWEPEQTAVILRHLRPGAVVLNVGANTGYFALLMASMVKPSQGHVHAFEFQPSILEIFRRNVVHNGLQDAITIVELGCFSRETAASIDLGGDPGAVRISFEPGDVPVRLTTIDHYAAAAALTRVDLILIDTEGADFEVLKGAVEVLRRFRPTVIAEVKHLASFGGSEQGLCAFMEVYGYSARPLDGDFARDLVFVPERSHPVSDFPR